LGDAGIPVFADPSRAVRALQAGCTLEQRRRQLHAVAVPMRGEQALGPCATEAQAKARLADAGLSMLPERACATRDEAMSAARDLGFPVVAKILSPDITHKTEIGGVRLNLADAQAVGTAFDIMCADAARLRPGARIDGVLIAPMLSGGIETIAGVGVDPVFGPMIMFGLGGTMVELFRDVAFGSAPLTRERAASLVHGVQATALLHGWRGAPPADLDALVETLVKLSHFAAAHAHEIDAVDINPLVVRPAGQGCVCLDAVITRRAGA
jgi:acyl-CoA synthetase (NDP forming)